MISWETSLWECGSVTTTTSRSEERKGGAAASSAASRASATENSRNVGKRSHGSATPSTRISQPRWWPRTSWRSRLAAPVTATTELAPWVSANVWSIKAPSVEANSSPESWVRAVIQLYFTAGAAAGGAVLQGLPRPPGAETGGRVLKTLRQLRGQPSYTDSA